MDKLDLNDEPKNPYYYELIELGINRARGLLGLPPLNPENTIRDLIENKNSVQER